MKQSEESAKLISLVKRLNEEVGLPEWYAEVFAAHRGKCAYCDEDLVGNRISFSAAMIDHILPKGKYPNFASDPKNFALSCASCSSIKRGQDVLREGEDPEGMLKNERGKLIKRIRTELQEDVQYRNGTFLKVAEIFRSELLSK